MAPFMNPINFQGIRVMIARAFRGPSLSTLSSIEIPQPQLKRIKMKPSRYARPFEAGGSLLAMHAVLKYIHEICPPMS